MKFSIVIPLYNKRPYIGRCVRSVLQQTHFDFELIVVNDGSTDGGEQELAQIADNRLHIVHQTNQGVSVARNRGVAAAHHGIIFFLDADDTWETQFLAEMARLVTTNPESGIYACGTRKVFADGRVEHCELDASVFVKGTSVLANYLQTFVDLEQSPFSNSSFGVRKEIFDRVGGYTPGVKLTEDSDLWVRLALITQIAINPLPLANYFVEIDNNTRIQAQTSNYEVIQTLENALATDKVPKRLQRGAQRLLALQKNAQIKRLIILGKKYAAWKRLWDSDVWTSRPRESFSLALAASLPRNVFVRLYKLKAMNR
jgi:glycosyltransferase involved in cell wall biosynthesis